MKLLASIAVVVGLFCSAGVLDAQVQVIPGGGGVGTVGPGAFGGSGSISAGATGMKGMGTPMTAEAYIDRVNAVTELSDEQKASINEIYNNRTIDMALYNMKNADKSKELMATMMKGGRGEDAQKTMQEYQAIYAGASEIAKKYDKQLEKTLTADQVKKLKDSDLVAMIKRLAKPADLTDAQVKAVKGTITIGEDGSITFQDVRAAIDNVLTPEQKTQIAKTSAMWNVRARYWAAKLTQDQLKDIESSVDQILKDSTLTSQQVNDKLAEKVDGMLTAEQKKSMEDAPKWGTAKPLNAQKNP